MTVFRSSFLLGFLLILFCTLGSRAFSQTTNISPDSLYFGRVPEGKEAIRGILIFNIGVQPLQVSQVRIADAALFSFVEDPGSFTLNLAESKLISIRFQPQSRGPAVSQMIIESNATSGPNSAELTGEGTRLDKGVVFFERIMGGPESDRAGSVNIAEDGGYIIAGSTVLPEDDQEFGDAALAKTDEYGQVEWSRSYGLRDWGEGFSEGILTADGGYIAVGSKAFSDRVQPPDVYVVRVDADGDLVWERTYGRSEFRSDTGADIIATSDGGFLIAGTSESVDQTQVPPKQHDDVYLIKIDSEGTIVWERVYGDLEGENAASVKLTTDGGYIFVGSKTGISTTGENDYDFYLVKTDADGNAQWEKTFGGTDWDRASSVIVTADGGYLMAGFTASPEFGAVARDVFVVKADATGDEQWHRSYGWDHNDGASEVIATADGGYCVVGGSARHYDENLRDWRSDMYVLKTDASGNLLWERLYGGLHEESASSVRQTTDGGYVISGFTRSYSKDNDVYFLKVDEHGSVTSVSTVGNTTPNDFLLGQNFPNPFNAGTTIEYRLPGDGHVSLDIFNIHGQKVRTLVNEFKLSGQYKINFEAHGLASGLYFYRMKAASLVETKRMLLLK